MEEWKWIIYNGHDFTNKYMISSAGVIKSVDKYSKRQYQFFAGRIIKKRLNARKNKQSNTAYETVTLFDDGQKIDVEVHRLVATMFVPNPENKRCVNHKDGNGCNNNSENLEWCTYAENVAHSMNFLGNNPKKWKSKPVVQKDTNGNTIKVWQSAWEIQRQLGFCQVSISRCCRREKKSGIAYGFLWDFAEKKEGDENDETASS